MSFAAVATVGVKVARAIMLGANTVEGMRGEVKGNDKRKLALQVATEALGFCQENVAIPMTAKVREAWADYTDAYVKLQNALAEGK